VRGIGSDAIALLPGIREEIVQRLHWAGLHLIDQRRDVVGHGFIGQPAGPIAGLAMVPAPWWRSTRTGVTTDFPAITARDRIAGHMRSCRHCSADLTGLGHAVFCPGCGGKLDSPTSTITPLENTFSGQPTLIDPDLQAATLTAGEEFDGRYAIDRCVGAGGMGVVYVARDRITARQVAIKLIKPSLVASASAKQRFLREGILTRDLRHKNIIAMYDVGEVHGQLYLVMEYLAGDTLRTYLRRKIRGVEDVPLDVTLGIIRNILEGLSAAHDAGVVHRDLKPENIVLLGDPDEGQMGLKILDFGIARTLDNDAGRQVTSSTSSGTLLYMSPEQRTAADSVGPPADLYAVSAILFELLVGVPPSGASLSRERPDLPASLDAIVEKGLSTRARRRYQTASEYLQALQVVTAESRAHEVPAPARASADPAPRAVQADAPPPSNLRTGRRDSTINVDAGQTSYQAGPAKAPGTSEALEIPEMLAGAPVRTTSPASALRLIFHVVVAALGAGAGWIGGTIGNALWVDSLPFSEQESWRGPGTYGDPALLAFLVLLVVAAGTGAAAWKQLMPSPADSSVLKRAAGAAALLFFALCLVATLLGWLASWFRGATSWVLEIWILDAFVVGVIAAAVWLFIGKRPTTRGVRSLVRWIEKGGA
jgi:serine/threonine protein kinase